MKNAKLVLGIISCVLFLVVTLQSCAAGVGNALADNGETSGSAGFITALFMLAGGITAIAGRKSKGGAIACIVLYGLGAIIGFVNAGSYSDLKIWSAFCLIVAVLCLISLFVQKFNPPKDKKDKTDEG